MASKQMVATYEGCGEVHKEDDGTVVGPASYSLKVWQSVLDGDVLGSMEVRGVVHGLNDNAPVAEKLILNLKDGRVFRFLVHDKTGIVIPLGGIEQ